MPATPSGPTRKRAPSGIGAPGHTGGLSDSFPGTAPAFATLPVVGGVSSCSAVLDTSQPPAARRSGHPQKECAASRPRPSWRCPSLCSAHRRRRTHVSPGRPRRWGEREPRSEESTRRFDRRADMGRTVHRAGRTDGLHRWDAVLRGRPLARGRDPDRPQGRRRERRRGQPARGDRPGRAAGAGEGDPDRGRGTPGGAGPDRRRRPFVGSPGGRIPAGAGGEVQRGGRRGRR